MSTISPPIADESTVHAWHADRLRAEWAHVRVEFVDVDRCDGETRVQAGVRLGPLTPADVHVELVTPPLTRAAGLRAAGRPLWSTRSLDNGCFVFEATIPAAEARAEDRWFVAVRPAQEWTGETGLPALHWPVARRRPLEDA